MNKEQAVKLLSSNKLFLENKINIIFEHSLKSNVITIDDLRDYIKRNKITNAKTFVKYYQGFERVIFQKALKLDSSTAIVATHLLRKKNVTIEQITKNKGNKNWFFNKWFLTLNRQKLSYKSKNYEEQHYKLIKQEKNIIFRFIDFREERPKYHNLYAIRDDIDLIHYIDTSVYKAGITTIIDKDFASSFEFHFLRHCNLDFLY